MDFLLSFRQCSDLALLVLRFGLGAIFLVHGLQKRAMWQMQPSEQMGSGLLKIMRLLSIAEPLGAASVFVGLFAQLAGFGFAAVMVSAIYMKRKYWGKKFTGDGGWEFEFMVLVGAIVLIILGSGAYSLDSVILGI